jgi:hypothetical protein
MGLQHAPPRSPDLTPINFLLEFIKDNIHVPPFPTTPKHLKIHTTEPCAKTHHDIFQKKPEGLIMFEPLVAHAMHAVTIQYLSSS